MKTIKILFTLAFVWFTYEVVKFTINTDVMDVIVKYFFVSVAVIIPAASILCMWFEKIALLFSGWISKIS